MYGGEVRTRGGGTYAIVAGNSDTVTHSAAVERGEDGVCGGGGSRCSESEGCGELHVEDVCED
jgi:hypothetical protein